MSETQITKERIKELAKESLAQAAEMPKKKYSMPAQQPVVDIEPNKKVNRIKLEADLNDLLFSAGGQAPGYRRQLNKILDQYL
jgi:uncharacterized protein (DUF4415 family)